MKMEDTPSRKDLYQKFNRIAGNRVEPDIATLPEERLRHLTAALEELAGSPAERRREIRRAVMCRVTVIDDGAPQNTQAGLQHDRSEHGVSILVRRQIAIGTRIRIQRFNEEVTGTVKQCRRDSAGYLIGVACEAEAIRPPDPPAEEQARGPEEGAHTDSEVQFSAADVSPEAQESAGDS